VVHHTPVFQLPLLQQKPSTWVVRIRTSQQSGLSPLPVPSPPREAGAADLPRRMVCSGSSQLPVPVAGAQIEVAASLLPGPKLPIAGQSPASEFVAGHSRSMSNLPLVTLLWSCSVLVTNFPLSLEPGLIPSEPSLVIPHLVPPLDTGSASTCRRMVGSGSSPLPVPVAGCTRRGFGSAPSWV
jgi:hypothetical protein